MQETGRSGSEGHVYILVNPAFTGYVKIGRTTKDPETRARELSSFTGVPAPYAVAWDAFVSDCHNVERLAHRRLAHARVRNDREFFAIPLREAVSLLAEIVAPYLLEQGTPHPPASVEVENSPAPSHTSQPVGTPVVQQPRERYRRAAAGEELIQVSEDTEAVRGEEPPEDGTHKTVVRIQYEVLAENPYEFTEQGFYHEVHVVRRRRTDLKIGAYSIKRMPLLKKYGWGIHRDIEGKLALVACESDRYRELLSDPSVRKTKAYRSKSR